MTVQVAKEVFLRRGTTTEHNSFTGASGELTVDKTKDTVVVHNGSTQGGFPVLKENNPTVTGDLNLTTSGNRPSALIFANNSSLESTVGYNFYLMYEKFLYAPISGGRWYPERTVRIRKITANVGELGNQDIQFEVFKNGESVSSFTVEATEYRKVFDLTTGIDLTTNDYVQTDILAGNCKNLSLTFNYIIIY